MKLTWNVYFINPNSKRVEQYNVFDNYYLSARIKEAAQECTTILEFSEVLKNAVRYCFAWKFEYEIRIGDMFGRTEEKFDIRHQLELNWDAFVEYVWKYRKEF